MAAAILVTDHLLCAKVHGHGGSLPGQQLGSRGLGNAAQEALIRNMQAVVQALHHPQAQLALAIQHLRYAPTGPDVGFQITWRQDPKSSSHQP